MHILDQKGLRSHLEHHFQQCCCHDLRLKDKDKDLMSKDEDKDKDKDLHRH